MNKRLKIFSLFLICLLLISQISVYTSLTPSTIPHANEESEDQAYKNPKVSDVYGWYEWDENPGDYMGITTLDPGVTGTGFSKDNGDYMYLVSEKQDDSTSTSFNGTGYLNINDNGEITYSEPPDVSMNLYNKTLSAMNFKTDLSFSATASAYEVEDGISYMESFYVTYLNDSSGESAIIDYDRDRLNDYALNLIMGDPSGSINAFLDYNETLNEFKWYDETHSDPFFGDFFTSDYIINESGVWKDSINIIDWSDQNRQVWSYTEVFWFMGTPYGVYSIIIVKQDDTIVFLYYTIIGGDLPLYQLIFTRAVDNELSMEFVLLQAPFTLSWTQGIITIVMGSGVGSPIFTFYIWDIQLLLYLIMYEYWQIKFFWAWVYIEHWLFTLEMWTFGNVIHWIIDSIFYEWYYKIQIFLDKSSWIFTDYIIHIQYLTYFYIYKVPTDILPNKLLINIIESIYTNTTFGITIKVTNSEGLPINDADISGTWDGIALSEPENITVNGDGTYDINITKILVHPTEQGKMLYIKAHKNGYANGTLNVEIGVDPDPLEPNTFITPNSSEEDDDDIGNKEETYIFLSSLIIIGIISCISAIAIAKFIIKRRTIIKKRGGLV